MIARLFPGCPSFYSLRSGCLSKHDWEVMNRSPNPPVFVGLRMRERAEHGALARFFSLSCKSKQWSRLLCGQVGTICWNDPSSLTENHCWCLQRPPTTAPVGKQSPRWAVHGCGWVDGGEVVGGPGWHEGSEGIMLLELADPELKTDWDCHCMLGEAQEILMEMRVERGRNKKQRLILHIRVT